MKKAKPSDFGFERVNDLLISHIDGDWQYEKKSGSYRIASILGSSRLKYCLKHSITHRRVLDSGNFEMMLTDEYKFYRQLKDLIEIMLVYIEIRDGDFYGIRLIVEYGNKFIHAQDYRDLPEFPRNIEFRWYSQTYENVLNLIDSIESLKHKQFTQKAKAA